MRGGALIAVGLLAAGPAFAADPWLVAKGVNGMSVSSDASTLSCSRGQCSIWETTRYAAPEASGVVAVRDLADYDCLGRRTRTQMEIKLGPNDEVLTTVKASDRAWSPVRSGTVGAVTLTFACGLETAAPAGVRSGAVEIDGQRFVRLAQAASAGAPRPSRPAGAAPPARAAPVVVQIAASSTEAGARDALAAFERRREGDLAGLQVRIQPATVKGARVFRALVEGFASDHDARALCAALEAHGMDCFVRPRASGGEPGE